MNTPISRASAQPSSVKSPVPKANVVPPNGTSPSPATAPNAKGGAPLPKATPSQPPSAPKSVSAASPAPAPAKANAPIPTPAPKSASAPSTQAPPAQPPSAPAQPSPAPAQAPSPSAAPESVAKADVPEFEGQLLTALRAIWRELREIKKLLEAQQQAQPSPTPAEVRAPNLRRLLSEYPSFNWDEIGAKVLSADEDGATAVAWGGHTFVRRTNPKFGAEVWFSRATGRGEDGEISYERLITFAAPPEVEPLPRTVRDRLR